MWDTNTIQDELELEDTPLFHLITGQFPQHSAAFYKVQARQARASVAAHPDHLKAYDDLGVAYTKLGQFDAALKVFQELDARKPGRYETQSNLGVLHKKMGQFQVAAKFIERALRIKPSGHMGLGDWYLKMIRYQGRAQTRGCPQRNFLGHRYADSDWLESLSSVDEAVVLSQLKALIRNDRHFPDSYVVLGDLLDLRQRKKNLALWCYARALELGHAAPQMVRGRIAVIHRHWKDALVNTYTVGKYVQELDEMVEELRADLRQRDEWVERFKDAERELLEEQSATSFPLVAQHLQSRKRVLIQEPSNYGIRRTKSLSQDLQTLKQIVWIIAALLGLILALRAKKSWTLKEV